MHCNFNNLAREASVHTINAVWLSVTVFRQDESRESESVTSIFVFRVLGLWVIFRHSAY